MQTVKVGRDITAFSGSSALPTFHGLRSGRCCANHRFHSATCSQTFGIQGAPAHRRHIKAGPNRHKTKGLGFDSRRVNVAFRAEAVARRTCGSFLEDVSYSHPKCFLKEDQGRSFLDERRNVFKETSARPAASTSTGTQKSVLRSNPAMLWELPDEKTTHEKGSACFLERLSCFSRVQSPVSVGDLHVCDLVQTNGAMETTLSWPKIHRSYRCHLISDQHLADKSQIRFNFYVPRQMKPLDLENLLT